jgi:hypothetical protein
MISQRTATTPLTCCLTPRVQFSSQLISLDTALKPLRDEIDNSSVIKTKNGRQYVADLKNELTDWQKQYPNGLTVETAQATKRAMYKRISDRLYADNYGGITPADKAADILLAKGLKDAISEKVPEVDEPNNYMHTAIVLRDALDNAAKQNPGFRSALAWALGEAGFGLMSGHSEAGVIAGATQLALSSPVFRSRLAQLFWRAPGVFYALGRAGQFGSIAGRGLTNMPLSDTGPTSLGPSNSIYGQP